MRLAVLFSIAAWLWIAVAVRAWAGLDVPPAPIDTSQFVTQSQAAAQSASDVATATAAIPGPCSGILLPDTLMGTSGAASPCVPRADAARPTVVQAVIVTTDSTGAWSVTWAKAFNSATPYINPQAINVAGSQPYICNVASSTTTTATGKCWQTLTTTLPSLALSLLGLVINPTGGANAIQVRVAARDTTQ